MESPRLDRTLILPNLLLVVLAMSANVVFLLSGLGTSDLTSWYIDKIAEGYPGSSSLCCNHQLAGKRA